MNANRLKQRIKAGLKVLLILTALSLPQVPASAQSVTTGSLGGRVLGPGGNPIIGAEVEIIHEPTGTRTVAITRGNGSFMARSLRPGGPYTAQVSQGDLQPAVLRSIFVDLDRATDVVLILRAEQIVELDAYVVTGSESDRLFSADRAGLGSQLSSRDIAAAPVGDRSLNSLLRLDPRIVYNRDPSDRAFSAGGASNRYNSIKIDGVSASDPFGLNGNNTAAERNVIPLDSVESINIATSPFDARSGGFTGASISAVTKSGGNEHSGSLYMLYRDDNMVRENLDGVEIPAFEETTMGFTLGGPILKDKLFYFVSYEKVDEDRNPPSITNFPTSEALTRIINQAQALGLDPGNAARTVNLKLTDENLLAKIDWQINDDHRFSFRYNSVESERPTFPGYGGRNLSFDSHWYNQEIENTSYIAQLFSNWSSSITSEISLSYSEYRSEPTWSRAMPQVTIYDVPVEGTNQFGTVKFGTERSRHFNLLEVDTWTLEAVVNWEFNLDNTLSFGYQLESNDIYNAFVQDWLGNYEFDNIEAFEAAGQEGWSGRYRYQFENPGVNAAAEFSESNHALFIQNEYRPNNALSVTFGLRMDMPKFGDDVPLNETFRQDYGFANNATYDGNSVIQPRVGFNWKLDEAGNMQLRGGVGLFYGRMPRVWMSNSYSNTGMNFSSIDLRNESTPAFSADPYNQGTFPPAATAMQVVALDPDFELPSTWKATLGYDHRIWGHVFTAETEHSWTNSDVLFVGINRSVSAIAPDGRDILSGRVSNNFVNDIIYLTNTEKGFSRNITLSVERDNRDNGWFWKASYVNGYVREVQYGTSSVARSNWANRAVLNQGENVTSRGELEVAHRFLAILQKSFELKEGYQTSMSLVYDGRSGYPFSFRASNDVNGDGVSNNDLIYVPVRGDTNYSFATSEDETTFYRIVDAWGLKEGTHARSGAGRYPFVHQFDFNITQEFELPGWKHKLELSLDILNIGNLLNDEWGLIKGSNSFFVKSEPVAQVNYDPATNTYTYSRVNADLADKSFDVAGGRGEPSASRWAALLSIRYRF